MLTIGSQRSLFDIPAGIAYFNTAYNSPLLNTSCAALMRASQAKSHPWERPPADFFSDADRIRQLASVLFGGDADGYAVVPAASYGLSAAARAMQPTLRVGDRIVVLDEEFPSNVLPWRRVATETGAVVATVPRPRDDDWTTAVLAILAQGARVAAVSPCHWTNGARLDLVAIGRACRAAGTALVIDASQALGAIAFDMAAVRPDFLVAAGYKWLLCPYGVGLMYVDAAWREAPPLEETWLARANAADFTALVDYSDTYMPGARRFDVGEKCTALLPGAIAALEQLQAWGVDNIARVLGQINSRIASRLEALGFTLPPRAHRSPHIVGGRLPQGLTRDFVGSLRAQRVFISQRGSSIRIAPHLHVTEPDIEQLFAALDVVAPSVSSS
jgi:selenocysteine lyase/cysteine desulfurase